MDPEFHDSHETGTIKSIELDEDLKKRLEDIPEVLEFIERLQRTVQKQAKKIIKWKMKVKQLQERKFQHASTQTEQAERSIVETIREAAEEATKSTGFVYEETSGLYYDYNSGYYYNAEYGLYYDGNTGTYLKYNQDTMEYEFHSQIDSSKTNKYKSKAKRLKLVPTKPDFEEGECSDSSDSTTSDSSDVTKQYPPCMRLIVKSTEIPKLKTGTLFLITCDGGTVGREGNHSINLHDINVSKHHLKIAYNLETSVYTIVDLGSRNGTYLNGNRLASSKQESAPMDVTHGCTIQLGSTTLLCHIHEGTQTCENCEPGLLIENDLDVVVVPKRSEKTINQQYKSELKRLRKQHGFLGSTNESKLAKGYTDRAEKRRVEMGSQNPYEKTESASTELAITSKNVGFKLLEKMGWKEGDTLGKEGGLMEPINVVGTVGVTNTKTMRPKENVWQKAQARFEKLEDFKPNIE